MIPPFNGLQFGIVVAMFAVVTVLGFMATRWKRATSLASVEEWGLGGRQFGTWVTWFLLGGDLYTAYTFVAVPALLFGAGATGSGSPAASAATAAEGRIGRAFGERPRARSERPTWRRSMRHMGERSE